MTGTPVAHFAINADDVERAKGFYERVFGWRFIAWGPPGFYQIDTGAPPDQAPKGALQARREVVEGRPVYGYECTVAVADVHAVAAAATAGGGRVVMEPAVIAGVGELIFIEDPEGNVAGAMRYDPAAGQDE
jgi:predicted enzyme related to lactoylglutathione lyase